MEAELSFGNKALHKDFFLDTLQNAGCAKLAHIEQDGFLANWLHNIA